MIESVKEGIRLGRRPLGAAALMAVVVGAYSVGVGDGMLQGTGVDGWVRARLALDLFAGLGLVLVKAGLACVVLVLAGDGALWVLGKMAGSTGR